MLDKTFYSPLPAPLSTSVISGQTIAKSGWHPRYRADLAARWRLGLIQVSPSTKMAAGVFSVSVPLVAGAIKAIGDPAVPPLIDLAWNSLSEGERDAFVRRHLLAIWNSIEHVTR